MKPNANAVANIEASNIDQVQVGSTFIHRRSALGTIVEVNSELVTFTIIQKEDFHWRSIVANRGYVEDVKIQHARSNVIAKTPTDTFLGEGSIFTPQSSLFGFHDVLAEVMKSGEIIHPYQVNHKARFNEGSLSSRLQREVDKVDFCDPISMGAAINMAIDFIIHRQALGPRRKTNSDEDHLRSILHEEVDPWMFMVAASAERTRTDIRNLLVGASFSIAVEKCLSVVDARQLIYELAFERMIQTGEFMLKEGISTR